MARLMAVPIVLSLALAACGSRPAGTPGAAPADVVVETATGSALMFVPASPHAAAASHIVLVFRNRSSLPHNLTFSILGARTDTIVSPGGSQTIEVNVPGPGSYPFVCTIHPGMQGALLVR